MAKQPAPTINISRPVNANFGLNEGNGGSISVHLPDVQGGYNASITDNRHNSGSTPDYSVFLHICDDLIVSGWRELNRGSFARVYWHPDCPDTVLKVGQPSDEDGWLSYARTLIKTRSVHAPRVHAIEINDDFYFAEIERLDRLPVHIYGDLGIHENSPADDVSHPTFAPFLRRTERIRKRFTDHHSDYHSGNFMVRPGTGDVVCTDPWA